MTSPSPQKAGGSLRCRQCGARLTNGDEWCSLCLTPVAGSPEPEKPPGPPEPVVPLPRDGARPARPDGAEVGEMLAGLAADEKGTADRSTFTVFKAHLALGQLPGGRYAVAFGGGLLLLVLLMAGLTVLGAVL